MKKITLCTFFLIFSAHAFADTQLVLSTGIDFSTGKYGTATTTDMLYIPVTAKYQTSTVTTRLTIPYIQLTSNGNVIPGVGATTTTTGARTTQSGLGDAVLSEDFTLTSRKDMMLDFVGKIKFGTADSNKALGTGKNDYSGQLDFYKTLSGPETLFFATAGYKFVGTPNGATATYNNVAFGTMGINQKLSKINSIGGMLDVSQSVVSTSPGPRDAMVYISHALSDKLKLQANMIKGLSNGSADYGGGLTILGTF